VQIGAGQNAIQPAFLDTAVPMLLTGEQALEANAAIPVAAAPSPAAAPLTFAGANPVASYRALDCLAQAIYYEARSESEDGQRAVAQVVLNRVRHPAWPNSVCGVVYQGPMRPGGGCQFTFTCDGSLAYRPHGAGWARAQRLAAEALAGRVFAPVGLSTFYHANYVLPGWAPRLLKIVQIGTHIFYRLPGGGGMPRAFSSPYAGVEPVARPNPVLFPRHSYTPSGARIAAVTPTTTTGGTAAGWSSPAGSNRPQARAIVSEPAQPVEDLQVRPEYRQSGQWRSDAPAALTGR
jgi:spore germination cell wall hydrolase CwlJ-like protein